MKRGPESNFAWIALLGAAVQMAALGLCSWAMESERKRGRALPGATGAAAPMPAAADTPPPFESAEPAWAPGVPAPGTGSVPPPPAR